MVQTRKQGQPGTGSPSHLHRSQRRPFAALGSPVSRPRQSACCHTPQPRPVHCTMAPRSTPEEQMQRTEPGRRAAGADAYACCPAAHCWCCCCCMPAAGGCAYCCAYCWSKEPVRLYWGPRCSAPCTAGTGAVGARAAAEDSPPAPAPACSSTALCADWSEAGALAVTGRFIMRQYTSWTALTAGRPSGD